MWIVSRAEIFGCDFDISKSFFYWGAFSGINYGQTSKNQKDLGQFQLPLMLFFRYIVVSKVNFKW